MRLKILIAILVLLALCPGNGAADNKNSDETNIYFNAGTEQYLKGNYKSAVENLEKAMGFDPQNAKIKELIVKILLDAATQEHLSHRYPGALEYLEKAKSIDPGNSKIMEMYQLTKEILSSVNTRHTASQEKALPLSSKTKNASPQQEPSTVSVVQKEAKKAVQERVQVGPSLPGNAELSPPFVNQKVLYVLFALTILWGITATVLFVTFLVLYKQDDVRVKKIPEMQEEIKQATKENIVLQQDLEKSRELLAFEHQTVIQLRNDLDEVKKMEYEKMKLETTMRVRMKDEKTRKALPDYGSILMQQDGENPAAGIDPSPEEDDLPSPRVAALRERISIMASNLYNDSPQAAMEFIQKIANDPNPSIKANIIPALARISSDETIGLLLRLCQDPSYKVKREALKNISEIDKRIKNREIELQKELLEEIARTLSAEKKRGEWIF